MTDNVALKCVIVTLSDDQVLEMDSRVTNAEVEFAVTERHGPKQADVAFHSIDWLRRLIDEVKQRRDLK